MNRSLRRAMASEMRRQAKAWPSQLEPVPGSEWPERAGRKEYPTAVWRSREYLVQAYAQPPFNGALIVRLSVNRVTMGAGGRWHADISWDDLQRLKREAGYGDWYAFEVYPRERDIVNVANMRHIWMLSEPLPIGWFA